MMFSVVAGVSIVSVGAYGLSSWGVGLAGGSSSEAQSAPVSNLTITAQATPGAANVLYPGATGDVVALIANPNPFPVTITGVYLPLNTSYASGFTTSNLSVTESGCSSATSDVLWSFAGAISGAAHTLVAPLTVGANARLSVTFVNDATMTSSTPSACEGTYFLMPPLAGLIATSSDAPSTPSPASDGWIG
jgi:hypothetical protein